MSYSQNLFACFFNGTLSWSIWKYLTINKMIALNGAGLDYLRQSNVFLN